MGIEELARQFCSSVGLCEPTATTTVADRVPRPNAVSGGEAPFRGPTPGTRLQALQNTPVPSDTPVNPLLQRTPEVRGKREIGQVEFVRQWHYRPEMGADLWRRMGDYQLEMLRYMESERPRHIFEEGLETDLPPNDPSRGRNGGPEVDFVMTRARELFSEGVPRELNDNQRRFIAQFGATKVYAALHDDVYLHRTVENAEMEDRIQDQTDRASTQEQRDYYTCDVREAEATRHVVNFFRQPRNRGERVFLVFGGGHDFGSRLAALGNSPEVHSVQFRIPGLRFDSQCREH